MILTLDRVKGTLTATADTVVATVSGGSTVDIYGTFANTGSTNRLLRIKIGGVYVLFADSSNDDSILKPGGVIEVHLRHKLLDTETIQAWQSVGSDVDYFITVGILPE